jgi:hypothetical protein
MRDFDAGVGGMFVSEQRERVAERHEEYDGVAFLVAQQTS